MKMSGDNRWDSTVKDHLQVVELQLAGTRAATGTASALFTSPATLHH